MLERQDIDALLVGALYGELSSADEARLTQHLEAHPADRNTLDDLKSARAVVRGKVESSRIFELQLEPPQAVSALLLQEAARRAPKVKPVVDEARESWFQRFVHSFIAHPAMAAAATLVLVVGVAGTVYLKQGDKFAEQTVAQSASRNEAVAAGAPAPVTTAAEQQGSSAVAVGLAEDEQAKPEGAAKPTAKPDSFEAATKKVERKFDGERSRGDALAYADDGKDSRAKMVTTPTPSVAKPMPAKAAKGGDYVEVTGTDRQPKDLDERRLAKADKAEDAPGRSANGAMGAGGAAAAGAPMSPTAHSSSTIAANGPRNADPSPQAQAPVAAPATTGFAEPPPPPKSAKPDSNFAWAKDQHARVTALVKDGKCQDAGPVAASIRSRDPEYYNSYVATDRALKQCMQYVNAAADREAEKAAAVKAKRATATDTK